MDSVRETMRAHLASAANEFSLIEGRVAAKRQTQEEGQAEWNAELERRTDDAFMALLPQVGVRPLVWETTSSKDGPFDFDGEFAVTGVGRIYAIEPDGGSFLVGRLGDDPIWEKQSLTDARAVAEEDWRLLVTSSAIVLTEPDQADLAQRITSALVQPSGVVSDAMVAKVIEEAIVFFQDNIRGILSVEDRSEDLNEELAEPVHSTISCLRGYLAHIRARSLTNGEG